jgi:hypothetical protein
MANFSQHVIQRFPEGRNTLSEIPLSVDFSRSLLNNASVNVPGRLFSYLAITNAMKIIIFLLFSTICITVEGQPRTEPLLNRLDSVVEHRDVYVENKLKRIDEFKSRYNQVKGNDQFYVLENIYEEYKSFSYDSAFLYALKLQKIARNLRDPVKLASSKIRMGFVLVSAGLLYEALDTLRTVRLEGLPASVKNDYYFIVVRTYYDLARFVQNYFFGDEYVKMGSTYTDTAMLLMPPNSVNYLIVKGLRSLHARQMPEAKIAYEDLIFNYQLSDQQFAIVASTLSYIYSSTGDLQNSREMLISAAISDIKSCTKETYALLKLAEVLHSEGDIEHAYQYIKVALEDANFYGARQRKMQVAAVFPVIEADRISIMESRRKMLLVYSFIITISAILIIGILYLINKQNKKLQKARRIISRANKCLQEANKIKEEYLWYYFNTTAEYIGKLDALKATIELKVACKKIEDLKFTASNINVKKERSELFHNFDKVFLKLFPNFVLVINSILNDEGKIALKDDQLLNTELRIFALIRLGIHDHEKIAKILGYSLTTIYTYKTKVKARSLVSGETFDKYVAEIPAN